MIEIMQTFLLMWFFRREMRRKNKLHRLDPTAVDQVIFRNHRFLTTLVTTHK